MLTLHPSSLSIVELNNILQPLLQSEKGTSGGGGGNNENGNGNEEIVDDLELLTIHTGLICPSFESVRLLFINLKSQN